MSKSMRFKAPVIDDVLSSNVDAVLQERLFDLFGYAMRSVAVTRFHTDDFATSRSTGCDGFTLAMRQVFPGKRDAWAGAFERGEQRLEVIGYLESAPVWPGRPGHEFALQSIGAKCYGIFCMSLNAPSSSGLICTHRSPQQFVAAVCFSGLRELII